MRNVLIISLLSLFSSSAFAERLYGMAGCGLGQAVMGTEGGQVSAATTNSTFWNQGFGISSGTLNCLEPSKAAALESQKTFFVNNIDQLSKEMAQGQGQYLEAFAQTFGCNQTGYSEFSQEMKKSYQDIFSSPGAGSMLEQVRSKVKGNSDLKNSCANII